MFISEILISGIYNSNSSPLSRVLSTRSADDFYGKMGSFSSELLNGHLIDSNGLIEKVVQLGPIQDIQKLRDKHLYSVAPLKNKQGLK